MQVQNQEFELVHHNMYPIYEMLDLHSGTHCDKGQLSQQDFGREVARVEAGTMDREVNGIRVHDAKLTKNQ